MTSNVMSEWADGSNLHIDKFIIVLAWMVVGWIIFSSAVVLLCFFVNRNKSRPSFAVYIMMLTVCDFCNGVFSSCLLIAQAQKDGVQSVPCASVFFLFFFSQLACLYHVLGICLLRNMSFHVSFARAYENKRRLPVFVSATSWFMSGSVSLVPFVLWITKEEEISECVIQQLFTDLRRAMGFLAIFYIIPQFLTNILYLVACLRLRFMWLKVSPGRVPSEATSRTHVPTSSNNDAAFEFTNGQNHMTSNQDGKTEQHTATLGIGNIRSNGLRQQGSQSYNCTRMKIQRKVLGTIGMITLWFNICTIPLIVMLLMESQLGEIARNIRFLSCIMFTLNSALNPFIYALRSDWLKKSLRNMFHTLINFCFI